MMIMRDEVMMRMRAIMKTIFTGAAHGESEDGGGVAVAVAGQVGLQVLLGEGLATGLGQGGRGGRGWGREREGEDGLIGQPTD